MGERSVKSLHGEYSKGLVFLFLTLYPLSVVAGQGLFHETTGFTYHQAFYALVMGFWGALAAFTQKWVKGETVGKGFQVFVKDLVNSTLASSIALMLCVYKEVPPALIGVVCSLGGYGGVSFLDFIYKRFVNSTADKAVG